MPQQYCHLQGLISGSSTQITKSQCAVKPVSLSRLSAATCSCKARDSQADLALQLLAGMVRHCQAKCNVYVMI